MSAAEEAGRLIDNYFKNYQTLSYTRVNPETRRVEPITPTLQDTPDDLPEETHGDPLPPGERRIVPSLDRGRRDDIARW